MALDRNVREPSDAELLTAVAAGDERAHAVLWSRHEAAARRLATELGPAGAVDDLVGVAFARVLHDVKRGGGPESALRPYLFETMRRFATGEVYYADDEQRVAWWAWQSLPDETRTLLWHLVIEEQTPAQVAPLLGISPNGVSSRMVRARERLRQAFLAHHLARADNDACRAARARLGAYLREALPTRARKAVQQHLDACHRCAAAVAELSDVNGTLRVVVAPIVLGGTSVAARYLGGPKHAAARLATAGGAPVAARRARHAQHGRSLVSVGGGAAAGVAAVTAGAIVIAYAAARHTPAAHTATDRPLAARNAITSSAPASPSFPPTTTATTAAASRAAPPSSAARSTSASPAPVAPAALRSTPATSAAASTASSAPAPVPSAEQQVVSIDLPGVSVTATVSISMPTGWTIAGVRAPGAALRTSGDAVHQGVWQVVGGPVSVTVDGLSGTSGTMHVHVRTLTSSSDRSYPLG